MRIISGYCSVCGRNYNCCFSYYAHAHGPTVYKYTNECLVAPVITLWRYFNSDLYSSSAMMSRKRLSYIYTKSRAGSRSIIFNAKRWNAFSVYSISPAGPSTMPARHAHCISHFSSSIYVRIIYIWQNNNAIKCVQSPSKRLIRLAEHKTIDRYRW